MNEITGRFELETNPDGSIQLRLLAPEVGPVDLVFVDECQFYQFVAGQHKDAAIKLFYQTPA